MKMYHVSLNIFDDIKEFYPRVPKTTMKGEDTTTERVCVAKTIEDCLNALLYWDSLRMRLTDNYEINWGIMSKCQRVFKIYEFDIEKDFLISPKDLYERNLVPDALLNNEYWCTKKLIPVKSYLIKITDVVNVEDKGLDIDKPRCCYLKIKGIDFEKVNENNLSEKAVIKFSNMNDEIMEMFSGISEDSLIYEIDSVNGSDITININKYPMERIHVKPVIDMFFCGMKEYVDIEFLKNEQIS